MKKIGIVSCYFKNNYGSVLQAYALQKVLDDNNLPNVTINVKNLKDFHEGKKKYYFSQLLNINFIFSKLGMLNLKISQKIHRNLKKNIKCRNSMFNVFRHNFHLTEFFEKYSELNKFANENLSDVIVGSDQLWLPVNVVADYYTLRWVPDKINKISYATSFGVSNIPKKYFSLYSKFLKRINYISVREQNAVDIANEFSGKKVELVCDPTLLLTKEQWMEIQNKERIIKEKYIFCYFLGNNIAHRKFAEKLRKMTGYKIISINHCDEYVKYSDNFADIVPYNVGPSEFLNYIRNAEYVCTDSFHGTIFSLINNVEFFSFRRFNKKQKLSTNSRLESLLSFLKLQNRLLYGDENVELLLNEKIDYEIINNVINDFKSKSYNWLINSLKNDNSNSIKSIELFEKQDCCGCTACKSICPQKAILMVPDEEGFLYPSVDKTKCINCGLCKKVCPILNRNKNNSFFDQKAYLMQNLNDEIRKDSTSGGFFSALGSYIIRSGGLVYGACFDTNFVVNHEGTNLVTDLYKFRKSKYVQSNLKNTFNEIKTNLDNEKLVCFSGTPCQISGLKFFLKKEYNNLITMDLMCHSVPSPLFFEKYKKYILGKLKANKIIDINFRDKCKFGYKYSMMTIVTDNGTYSEGIDTDPYLRAFFSDLSVRPSCYNCVFKTQFRISDFTVWDCFNVGDIDKTFDDDKGTTRILIQSEKGLNILNKIENCNLVEIKVDDAIKDVKEMTNSVCYNPKRKNLFKNINNKKFINKYFSVNTKTRINRFIRRLLCYLGLYSQVKKFLKRFL